MADEGKDKLEGDVAQERGDSPPNQSEWDQLAPNDQLTFRQLVAMWGSLRDAETKALAPIRRVVDGVTEIADADLRVWVDLRGVLEPLGQAIRIMWGVLQARCGQYGFGTSEMVCSEYWREK